MDGIMFVGESLRINPFEKRAIITSVESAKQFFSNWPQAVFEIYCIDFQELRIKRVINLRDAEEFFGKVF